MPAPRRPRAGRPRAEKRRPTSTGMTLTRGISGESDYTERSERGARVEGQFRRACPQCLIQVALGSSGGDEFGTETVGASTAVARDTDFGRYRMIPAPGRRWHGHRLSGRTAQSPSAGAWL